jgi:hypothetical protein
MLSGRHPPNSSFIIREHPSNPRSSAFYSFFFRRSGRSLTRGCKIGKVSKSISRLPSPFGYYPARFISHRRCQSWGAFIP